jgi:tetratricopeptide (TPR) repeat protein
MKKSFIGAALALCTSVSVLAVDARAQQVLVTRDTFGRPNAWEIAKNPRVMDEFAVHVAVQRFLLELEVLQCESTRPLSPTDRAICLSTVARAKTMVSDQIAKGGSGPTMQFDLGAVLYAQGENAKAAATLRDALTKFPNADGAHAAWLTYAFANSKLDRPDLECEGWDHYLAEEPNPGRRLVPTLNRAEANMRGHRLTEAIEDYRLVEQLAGTTIGTTETGVLAVWGLAIALDRQGDARGAAEQARIVSRMDPESPFRRKRAILDSDGVYFVPAYEKFWYLALAATEDAKQAGSAEESAREWAHVVALWNAYIEPAEKIEHPEAWNAIAIHHLAAAEKQLKAAEIRAKAEAKTKGTSKPPPTFQLIP